MKIEKLIKTLKPKLREEINDILSSFEKNKKLSKEEKFLELCFCILVANSSLEKTLEIWKNIGNDFLKLSKESLSRKLKQLGYRFYNKRAEYIVEARDKIEILEEILKIKDEFLARKMLVENFRGIGWKEASHFLRNLGYKNFAIIDRHVLKTLRKFEIIENVPQKLNKKTYLEIEEKLRTIAKIMKMSLAEMDLYLFYLSAKRLPIK